MKELFHKLREAECDVDAALERFLDDEDLYEQFYSALLNDEAFSNLGEALNENRLQDAFEYAHTLKGVIGNMGLTPLYETVCDIVEPLRINSSDGVNEKYEELLNQREYFSRFVE
ncbi:MAG: Hpt domain-containing protein [Clostridia bacterium]|nr:Hpt domain-containing protein [Clostridia bacterium]